MQPNRLRKELGDGKVVLGPFCKLTEAAVYEIIGLAGFDFAIIDMEHGPISYETAQNLIRTCELVGISPVVRVPKNEEHYILKALDIGAHGIEAPEINSKEQAEKLVESSRYYPLGKRGVCRFVRAAEYSKTPKEKYFFQANENTVVIGHLEGREGLANLDAILEVQGLNVIFIGPYDLSQSLGIPGQVHHPDLIEAMKVIVTKAKSRNKTVGTFVETPEDAKFWMAQGVTYIAYSVDVALILEKFSLIVNTVKPTGG